MAADINHDHPMATVPAHGHGFGAACAAAPAREASPRAHIRLSNPFDRALARSASSRLWRGLLKLLEEGRRRS